MQFDQLHTKIFALAKKGTQDTHFGVNLVTRDISNRDTMSLKPANKEKNSPLAHKHAPTSRKAVNNLKNLQFTLFD